MTEATLHDGSTIELEIAGGGPTLLLPVDPRPAEGERAEEMRKWGADPALGRHLIDGLADGFRVVAFDYTEAALRTPKPETLTPEAVAADLLAVADAAGADRFAYYGYSWLALSGLQLAIRTDRLTGLAMGGFPPIDGPYREMLAVTAAAHTQAVAQAENPIPAENPEPGDWDNVSLSVDQTRQFVTLYEALQGFDDRAAQASIGCPRLCLVGSADTISYEEKWGGVTVDLAGPIVDGCRELEDLGWEVHVLDGLDHMGAMQADRVVPVLRAWLSRHHP